MRDTNNIGFMKVSANNNPGSAKKMFNIKNNASSLYLWIIAILSPFKTVRLRLLQDNTVLNFRFVAALPPTDSDNLLTLNR